MIEFSNCDCKIERGKFDINNIPLNCPAVWRLLASGNTVGIFQLETKLGQDWARKVQPDNIEELAALVSLLRPGPLNSNLSQDYVDIKFGRKKATYIHPKLKPILEETYGVMVYQEQSLKIATDLAGFDPIEADTLRAAMGKKKAELMAQLKPKFIEGCQKHNSINKDIAEEIFGWIEKSQRYSFNLSHAIGYVLGISYPTAWVKCHFPQEFFTSYLTYSEYKSDPKDEIYKLIQDSRLFNVDVFPPDIRRGNIHFTMTKDPGKGIAFGLGHIRGVGSSAVEKIVSAGSKTPGTEKPGIKTWTDFLRSVPEFHRNVGIALIKSGACDCYDIQRSEMVRELEIVLGTTVRDDQGKKVEVKGLTLKEKEYFFSQLEEGIMTTREILTQMAHPTDNKKKTMRQMLKSELVEAATDFLSQVAVSENGIVDGDSKFVYTSEHERTTWIDAIKKRNKDKIIALMSENGYDDVVIKSPCSSDARRRKMSEKADMLEIPLQDTSRTNSIAEKHFLGIALSCSPADDADHSLATHTCLEIARAPNEETIVVCAIIDSVRHTKTKRGRNPGSPMCFLTISDSTYSIDQAVVFPDLFTRLKAFCKEDIICLIYGDKKNSSFIIKDIQKLI